MMTVSFLENFKTNSNPQAKRALNSFLKMGVPTKKIENWHYTSLDKILGNKLFTPYSTDAKASLHIKQTVKILVVNGQVKIDTFNLCKDDVELNIIDSNQDNLKTSASENADFEANNSMMALNGAFYNSCIFINIKKTISNPIHLSYVNNGKSFATFLRVVINVEKNAKAEIIETFESPQKTKNIEADIFINSVVEVNLKKNSRLSHYKIQKDSAKSIHMSTCIANVDKNGFYENKNISLNGDTSRNEVVVNLNGKFAKTLISGVFLTEKNQFVDNTIRVNHNCSHCDSSQLFKGILKDNSSSAFQGKIYVDKEAQKTDGYQMHRAIILSNDASVSCRPELEIYADDVKCSHGATTGEIDKQQLFYMLCRAIPKNKARHMLLLAFLRETLDDIENDNIKCFVENLIIEKTEWFLK